MKMPKIWKVTSNQINHVLSDMVGKTDNVALLLRTKRDRRYAIALTDTGMCDGDRINPDVNLRFSKMIYKFRTNQPADLLIMPIHIVYPNQDSTHVCMLFITIDTAYIYDSNGVSNEFISALSGALALTIQPQEHLVNLQEREEEVGDIVGVGFCAAWCLAVVEQILSNTISVSDAVDRLAKKAKTPKRARKFIQGYADQVMKKHKKCRGFASMDEVVENVRL